MNDEMLEVLKTTDEYLEKLKKGIVDMVEEIQSGNEMKGVGSIPAIADGIGWVLEAVNNTKPVQKEIIEFNDINEFLNETVEGIENEDYILVGDLFNYEILPILERIHTDIKKIL